MNFLSSNIDRAIVMTQYNLHGFAYPGAGRADYMSSAKCLDATTCNFMAFAAGATSSKPTDENFVSYFDDGSYENYLAMCQRLAEECENSQKAAIQIIIKEIVKQNEKMTSEVAGGEREASNYLKPLDKSNRWGRAVLALAEAFEVNLESVAT